MTNPHPTYNPDIVETLITQYEEAIKANDLDEQDRISKQLWEEWTIEIYSLPDNNQIMWYQR